MNSETVDLTLIAIKYIEIYESHENISMTGYI